MIHTSRLYKERPKEISGVNRLCVLDRIEGAEIKNWRTINSYKEKKAW